MEPQNISLNRPVRPKAYTSAPKTDIRQEPNPGDGTDTGAKVRSQASRDTLELYGGTGKVRKEQPAVRGSKIDIII